MAICSCSLLERNFKNGNWEKEKRAVENSKVALSKKKSKIKDAHRLEGVYETNPGEKGDGGRSIGRESHPSG